MELDLMNPEKKKGKKKVRESMVVLFRYSKDTCQKESRLVGQRRRKILELRRRRFKADFGMTSSVKGSEATLAP